MTRSQAKTFLRGDFTPQPCAGLNKLQQYALHQIQKFSGAPAPTDSVGFEASA